MKCICFADLDLAYYPKRKDRAAELQEFDVLLLIHFGDLVFLHYTRQIRDSRQFPFARGNTTDILFDGRDIRTKKRYL